MANNMTKASGDGGVMVKVANLGSSTIVVEEGDILCKASISVQDVNQQLKYLPKKKGELKLPSWTNEAIVTKEEFAKIQAGLERHKRVFELRIGKLIVAKYGIHFLGGKSPNEVKSIAVPILRFGPKDREITVLETEELLGKGLIEEASSPWNAAAVLVKKHDGQWRFCIDYRKLNAAIDTIIASIPKVDGFF